MVQKCITIFMGTWTPPQNNMLSVRMGHRSRHPQELMFKTAQFHMKVDGKLILMCANVSGAFFSQHLILEHFVSSLARFMTNNLSPKIHTCNYAKVLDMLGWWCRVLYMYPPSLVAFGCPDPSLGKCMQTSTSTPQHRKREWSEDILSLRIWPWVFQGGIYTFFMFLFVFGFPKQHRIWNPLLRLGHQSQIAAVSPSLEAMVIKLYLV
jgi:hypothetical protein